MSPREAAEALDLARTQNMEAAKQYAEEFNNYLEERKRASDPNFAFVAPIDINTALNRVTNGNLIGVKSFDQLAWDAEQEMINRGRFVAGGDIVGSAAAQAEQTKSALEQFEARN
jgi:predicted YcjX-like family ATPase